MMTKKRLLEGIWRLGWEAFKGEALLGGGHPELNFFYRSIESRILGQGPFPTELTKAEPSRAR